MSFRWTHSHFVCFVMSWLICNINMLDSSFHCSRKKERRIRWVKNGKCDKIDNLHPDFNLLTGKCDLIFVLLVFSIEFLQT